MSIIINLWIILLFIQKKVIDIIIIINNNNINKEYYKYLIKGFIIIENNILFIEHTFVSLGMCLFVFFLLL